MAGLRKVEDCRKAIDKGVDYILSRMDESKAETNTPEALNKLPLALLLAGRKRDSERLLYWIKKEMMSEGRLLESETKTENADKNDNEKSDSTDQDAEKSEKTGSPFWPNRMTAWVAIAAHRAGCFDISMPLIEELAECQGSICGGVYEDCDHSNRVMHHLITTACSGLAFLHCGLIEQARLAGAFLTGVPGKQPRGRTFYAWFDMSGRPIKDIESAETKPGGDSLSPQLYRSRKGQQYEIVGAPELFLAKLHQATDEPDFLAAARGFAHIGHRLQADAWRSVSGWLGAWGEASLLRITGRHRYLQFTQRAANHLVSNQDEESGAWLRETDYASLEEQPPAVSLSATASAVIALVECISEAQ